MSLDSLSTLCNVLSLNSLSALFNILSLDSVSALCNILSLDCLSALCNVSSLDPISAGTPNSEAASSAFGAEEECEQRSEDVPTVVVYLLDPFSSASSGGTALSSYLGLMQCFTEVAPLPENMRRNVIFQVTITYLC